MFRSQIAKAFYNQLKNDDSFAVSYGTWVEKEEGQGIKLSSYPSLEIEIDKLKKYNLDISEEFRNQLKEEYLRDADKIVVMAEREYIPDWLDKYKYEYWGGISNPEFHTDQIVEEVIKLLREKVLLLIN